MKFGRILKAIGRTVVKPVTAPGRKAQQGAEKIMTVAIMGILRHVLTFGGGYLWSGDDLTAFVGAAATMIGLVWSLVEKRNRKPAQ